MSGQADFPVATFQRAFRAIIQQMRIPVTIGILESGKQLELVMVQRQQTFWQLVFGTRLMSRDLNHLNIP